MTSWDLLAGPSTAAPTVQLTTATDRRLGFKLTDPSTLGFTINGRHEEALDLVELATDVHALRDGVPLFTGRLGSTSDALDGTTHAVTCNAADVRALLARRLTTAARNYSGADVATFVADMFNDAQAAPSVGTSGANLRITVPAFPATGRTITRTSKRWAPIATELAEAAGGVDNGASVFDYDVSPGWQAPTARLWTPGRGRDLTSGPSSVVLDYTFDPSAPRSSIVASITRGLDPGEYANVLRVTGGSTTTSNLSAAAADYAIRHADGVGSITGVQYGQEDDPTTPEDESTPPTFEVTITTTPVTLSDGSSVWDIGVWALAEDHPEFTTQSALDAYAASRLRELGRAAPSYTVKLRRNAWGGPEHVWLGDRVRLVIRSGRLVEDVALRVREVNVTLGASGEEDVDLVVGGPVNPGPLTVLRQQARAIAALRRATSSGS